jgi:hypothetical protein
VLKSNALENVMHAHMLKLIQGVIISDILDVSEVAVDIERTVIRLASYAGGENSTSEACYAV